jgi:hypothetical protein
MAFVGAPINDMTGNISSNKGGGLQATTMALGEEDGGAPPVTTMALGEDGTGAIVNPPAAGPPPPGAGPTFGGTITDNNVALVDPGAPLSDQAQYNFNAFGFNPTFTNPDGSMVFTGKDGISTIAPDLATANQQYLDTITQQLTSDVADLQGTNGVNPYIGQNLDSIQAMGNMYQSVTGNPFAGLSDAITTFQGGNVPAYNEPALSQEQQQQAAAQNQALQEQQALQQEIGVLPLPAPGIGLENTRAVGEDNSILQPVPGVTRAIGEDGNGPFPYDEITTAAIGEEGDFPPQPGNDILKPPGGGMTTQAVGEEEGDFAPIGGGMLMTQAMFEDGMPTPPAPPVANPYQPQPFNPRPPVGGGKGGGMQPQPQPQPQPFQPQPFQPQPFMPQPPMYGGGFGMPFGGSFGSPYGNPYGGGFGGGYGMQRPQPFGGGFYGNPYMPPPTPTPYGGGKGGGFGQQQMPQPQIQPQPQPQPGGKGGGQAPIGQNSTGGNFGNAPYEDDFGPLPGQQSSGGGFLGMLGAGNLLGGQQNTGGSSNNASPFGGSSGGGSRTAMF